MADGVGGSLTRHDEFGKIGSDQVEALAMMASTGTVVPSKDQRDQDMLDSPTAQVLSKEVEVGVSIIGVLIARQISQKIVSQAFIARFCWRSGIHLYYPHLALNPSYSRAAGASRSQRAPVASHEEPLHGRRRMKSVLCRQIHPCRVFYSLDQGLLACR